MQQKLVSIITPTYNSSKNIENLINTVKKQSFKNWELIIVDDCSTDNTTALLRKYKSEKIKIICLNKNLGCANARNIGIENAKGRYIAFLDSDDLWDKNKLKNQLNFMNKNNYSFCFTSYQYLKNNKLLNIVNVPLKLNYNSALKNTIIFTSTVIVDTNIINKNLLHMPNVASEDSATWWQILKAGYSAYGFNENLTKYRVGCKSSLSSNKFVALKRTWNLYRKFEKLSFLKSSYYFCFYVFNAIKRRI